MLDEETKYFDEHREEREAAHPGKHVLIKATSLPGFYDSAEEAVREGLRRLGRVPFLARPLSDHERVVHVPAIALGVPDADSPRRSER